MFSSVSLRVDSVEFFLIIIVYSFNVAGDEAIISASVAGEVVDASIVEVGRSRPQYQYTRVFFFSLIQ